MGTERATAWSQNIAVCDLKKKIVFSSRPESLFWLLIIFIDIVDIKNRLHFKETRKLQSNCSHLNISVFYFHRNSPLLSSCQKQKMSVFHLSAFGTLMTDIDHLQHTNIVISLKALWETNRECFHLEICPSRCIYVSFRLICVSRLIF